MLIKVLPDLPVQRTFVVGSFEVDADMSRDFIASRSFFGTPAPPPTTAVLIKIL